MKTQRTQMKTHTNEKCDFHYNISHEQQRVLLTGCIRISSCDENETNSQVYATKASKVTEHNGKSQDRHLTV